MSVELESAKRIRAVIDNINAVTGEADTTLASAANTVTSRYGAAYDNGVQAEYDRFWDELQQNGNRRNYWGAFASWTDEIFKPKYPIIANTSNSMFYLSTVTYIPTIDVSSAVGLINTFDYATEVVKIEKIILKADGSQRVQGGFNSCRALEEVRFEGVIGASISFKESTKLSRDSVVNIFAALSESASGQTLALSSSALTAAFGGSSSEEWQTLRATRPNWTISIV